MHDHPNRMRVLPTENIFDNSCFIGLGLVGFNISAAQRPEVIQNNMNGDIKWLTRDQRGLVTHDALHKSAAPADEPKFHQGPAHREKRMGLPTRGRMATPNSETDLKVVSC